MCASKFVFSVCLPRKCINFTFSWKTETTFFIFSFGEFFQPRKELNLWGWRGLIFLYSRKDRPKVHRNLNRTDAAPSAIGRTELQRQEGIEKDLGKGIKSRMWFFLFIGKWSEMIRMSMWTEVPHSSFFFNSGIFFHSLISGF